tara:strand:- start:3921 stop:4607 length:687 start_codon:yes stop_codon:yes gene_type:complete
MTKVIYLSLLILSGTLLFSACQKEDSSDVNQDKIYTVYELFYNANSDKTVAITRLRFGTPTGTLLELTGSAGVTFNGDVLPYSALYSGHAKEYAGKISGGTFIYTNTESQTFTNSTPSMDTLSFPVGFDTIIKSQANTMAWTGNALGSSERANLFVGSWTWGQDAIFFASSGAADIVMGVNQLSNLALGSSTCYIDRVNEVTVTQGTSEGGQIRTRYRPINAPVLVIQ